MRRTATLIVALVLLVIAPGCGALGRLACFGSLPVVDVRVAPDAMTVAMGASASTDVTMDRLSTRCEPKQSRVAVAELPDGVTVDDPLFTASAPTRPLVFTATADAAPGTYEVRVSATGLLGTSNTVDLTITVEAP